MIWSEQRGKGVVSSRLDHSYCQRSGYPASESSAPEIRISTLENESGPEKELKWKVMENGILDAIMEIKEGIP